MSVYAKKGSDTSFFSKKTKKCLTQEPKSVEYAARLRGKFIKKREDKLCGHFKNL